MFNIKKLVIATLIIFALSGCGAAPNDSETQKPPTNGSEIADNYDGFVFEYNNTDIMLGVKADPIINSLGELKDYFEAPSCAFLGLDKTYMYNGFDLYTYQHAEGEDDYVLSVFLLDDSVATPEGIYIGSDLDSVLSAYGSGYTLDSGAYTYTKGETTLSFVIENDVVQAINYRYITD